MGVFAFLGLAFLIGAVAFLICLTPVDQKVKTTVIVCACVIIVLFLLAAMGVFAHDPQIPRLFGR